MPKSPTTAANTLTAATKYHSAEPDENGEIPIPATVYSREAKKRHTGEEERNE